MNPDYDVVMTTTAGFSTSSIEKQTCNVCRKPDSHIRYNGMVCNACRVFFYRAVRDNLHWPCSRKNNCDISYKTQRSNCFSCRLRKCHEANMEPSDVGKKRRRGNAKVPRLPTAEMMQCLTNLYGSMLNHGPKAASQMQNIKCIRAYVNSLAGFDSMILSRGGPSPSSSPPQLDRSLGDVLMFPGSCQDRNTAANDLLSSTPINPNITYRLMSSLARMLVASAELMCLVDEFHQLSSSDRLRLLQHNSWGLNIILLRYERYVRGMGDGTYLQYTSRYRTTEHLTENWKKRETYSITISNRKPDELFYEIQPTDSEIMLLRLIHLFHPIPELSSEGYGHVLKARMRLLYILHEYISLTSDSLSKNGVQLRVGRLLELERCLVETSPTVRLFYLKMRLQNEEYLQPLEYDLFLRRF